MDTSNELLKKSVQDYWNKASCGTQYTRQETYTKSYFDEIEAHRYRLEPQIFSFAQFTRFHGKKVLEVGVGAGTDFVQWVRAGALAHGIDLTQEALNNTKKRLELEGLSAQELQVADAENVPYPDNFFDLVYSWGVIHHSPSTEQCLQELIRVCKPGGHIKFMVYNRHSMITYRRWIFEALLRGRPDISLRKILYNWQESPGTKGYTLTEMRQILERYQVDILKLEAPYEANDEANMTTRLGKKIARMAACLLGRHRTGWYLTVEIRKK